MGTLRRSAGVGVACTGLVAGAWLGPVGPAAAATVVASWEFSQSGGVVPAAQGPAYDLTLLGSWTTGSGSATDPSAIWFRASPALAQTSQSVGSSFDPGSGGFAVTVTFRATKDVTSGSPNLAQHGRFADPGQLKLQLSGGGRAGCRVKGTRRAYLFYHPRANVNDNAWHTLTCSRPAGSNDLQVTVDGDVFSPNGTQDPGSIAVPGQPFRFAQKAMTSSASDQFIGEIGSASVTLG